LPVAVGEQEDLLTVLEIREAAGADVALVSKDPDTNVPAAIVGVLPRARMAQVIHPQKELLASSFLTEKRDDCAGLGFSGMGCRFHVVCIRRPAEIGRIDDAWI
jgi:hypothetical protein